MFTLGLRRLFEKARKVDFNLLRPEVTLGFFFQVPYVSLSGSRFELTICWFESQHDTDLPTTARFSRVPKGTLKKFAGRIGGR